MTASRIRTAWAVATFSAFPLLTHAQPAQMAAIVVSATRTEQKLSDVILPVTVITREQIERSQAPTLVDLLQSQAGAEIARNGGPGGQASIFLRGQNSVSLAVFVDGVRMQTDMAGNLRMVDIPPEQIERIEILRGPAGALYGESAIGGAIHVYTRNDAEASGSDLGISYGSRRTSDIAAGYKLRGEDFRLGISVQRFHTDGFSAINTKQEATANPDKDGYERQAIFVKGEKEVSPDLTLGLSANRIQGKTQYDSNYRDDDGDFVNDALPTDKNESRSISSDVTASVQARVNASWRSDFRVTVSSHEAKEYINAVTRNDDLTEGEQTSWGWDNRYEFGPGTIGFGIEGGKAQFKTAALEFDRQTTSYFAGYNGRGGPVEYQAQVRKDLVRSEAEGNKQDQDAFTWLLGAGYWLTEQFKLFGSYATAFRAPAPAELFDVPAWGTTGNPDLKPEEHQGGELGLMFVSDWGVLRLAAFESTTRNAIAYDYPTYRNISRVENQGTELSFDGAAQGWTYKLGAVAQDPRDADTGERLKRRAREYGTLVVGKRLGRFDAGAQVIVSGDRTDSDIATFADTTLSGYTVVNLNASYTLTPEWTLRLKVENATGEDYQLVHGYNAMPFGAFVSAQYRRR